MLWEKDYVARKGDIVETGEGSLIARNEMNSWKAKDIKNTLLSGDELEE